jgi:hypothetical protein
MFCRFTLLCALELFFWQTTKLALNNKNLEALSEAAAGIMRLCWEIRRVVVRFIGCEESRQ